MAQDNTNASIEIEMHGDEIRIIANQDGILLMAKQLANLARNGIAGSHLHWDNSSIVDQSTFSIVVVKSQRVA